jgi:CheY-like chemotaxis protein
VDDDTNILEVLRVLLKQYGAQVPIAVSSDEALEVFHEWKPDVLISDLGMPLKTATHSSSKSVLCCPNKAEMFRRQH